MAPVEVCSCPVRILILALEKEMTQVAALGSPGLVGSTSWNSPE